MSFYTSAKALIWMKEGVLDFKDVRMNEVLSLFRQHALPMAVVTHDDDAARDIRNLPAFSVTQHTSTAQESALTATFLKARKALGTAPGDTVAIVGSTDAVISARAAGLPVIGFIGGRQVPLTAVDAIRDGMTRCQAFYVASAAIDLPGAVMQFRPFRENKWHPIAAPERG